VVEAEEQLEVEAEVLEDIELQLNQLLLEQQLQ
jgi:hypothetical protein